MKLDQLLQEAESHLREIQSRLTNFEVLAQNNANLGKDIDFLSQNREDEELPKLNIYIDRTFQELDSIISQAQTSLPKLNAQATKAAHKMRLDQVIYDTRQLRTNFQAITDRAKTQAKAYRDRQALLSTKFLPNDSSFHHRAGHETINMLAEENVRLKDSGHQVDFLLNAGRAVIDGLRHQRGMLQKSRKRLNDIINALGLSNTVMRIIERRTAQDKVILYGGMIVTTILILMILIYLR